MSRTASWPLYDSNFNGKCFDIYIFICIIWWIDGKVALLSFRSFLSNIAHLTRHCSLVSVRVLLWRLLVDEPRHVSDGDPRRHCPRLFGSGTAPTPAQAFASDRLRITSSVWEGSGEAGWQAALGSFCQRGRSGRQPRRGWCTTTLRWQTGQNIFETLQLELWGKSLSGRILISHWQSWESKGHWFRYCNLGRMWQRQLMRESLPYEEKKLSLFLLFRARKTFFTGWFVWNSVVVRWGEQWWLPQLLESVIIVVLAQWTSLLWCEHWVTFRNIYFS